MNEQRKVFMDEEYMMEDLKKQFDMLLKVSKTCDPEQLKDITEAMLKIYTTIYRF